MIENKNVKGIVLRTLVWQGLMLKPNTEFNFSVTREQYGKLKDSVVKFLEEFDNSVDEIIVEETKSIEDIAFDVIEKQLNSEAEVNSLENEIVELDDKIDESLILENELLINETIVAENELEEDKIVEELLAKREEIEEIKEKEREIAYERKQVNKARPIPASLKKRANKK